jgi:hypothetical protein
LEFHPKLLRARVGTRVTGQKAAIGEITDRASGAPEQPQKGLIASVIAALRQYYCIPTGSYYRVRIEPEIYR